MILSDLLHRVASIFGSNMRISSKNSSSMTSMAMGLSALFVGVGLAAPASAQTRPDQV